MRRTVLLGWFAAGVAGCFNPSPSGGLETLTDGEMTESTPTTTGEPTSPSSDPTNPSGPTTTSNDTDEPSDTTPDTESDTATESGAICGDGEVQGDEGCDDGVNDGSYGGCLADCSGPADFCGDSEVNGPEACDDGTNDGSYGGCATDCAALGPYCGDSVTNGPEGCDEGEDNENASGCNVDCVISGSSVDVFEMDGLTFCDGDFVTQPAFRDDGNLVVAATGYCDDDALVLAELNADLELVEDYADSVLVPQTPIYEGTLLGDDWLLSTYGCNYLISNAGVLTEVCEDREVGDQFLQSVDDDNYVALDYQLLARFGAGSPSLGDAPTWSVVPPDNATYDYSFYAAGLGPSGSTFVSGQRRTISGGATAGYLALYTAGGNLADSRTDTRVQYLYGAVASPDDTVVTWGTSPTPTLFKYDASLDDVWDQPLPGAQFFGLAIDSVGDIVCLYRTNTPEFQMRKLDPAGTVIKWTTTVASTYRPRIAIDESDHIYIASVAWEGGVATFAVEKYAP